MNCPFCSQQVLPGPLCCVQWFESILTAHETMTARTSGALARRVLKEDLLARETAIVAQWLAELPANERGRLNGRINALNAARNAHVAALDRDADADATRTRVRLAAKRNGPPEPDAASVPLAPR